MKMAADVDDAFDASKGSINVFDNVAACDIYSFALVCSHLGSSFVTGDGLVNINGDVNAYSVDFDVSVIFGLSFGGKDCTRVEKVALVFVLGVALGTEGSG